MITRDDGPVDGAGFECGMFVVIDDTLGRFGGGGPWIGKALEIGGRFGTAGAGGGGGGRETEVSLGV